MRVLAITFAFPPMAAPEAYLAAKKLGALPGARVDVVAGSPSPAYPPEDHSLDAYIEARFNRIVRVPLPWTMRHLPLARLGPLALMPDVYRPAVSAAVRSAFDLDPASYDVMVSWSQWHSSHLVGLALKQRIPSLPWVAHFSDPWTDNPFLRLPPWLTALNRRLERRVLEAADHLTMTSEETVRLMSAGNGIDLSAKTTVSPHSWDGSLYGAPPAQRRTGPRIARYLGAFYGARSPAPLVRSLARLLAGNVNVAERWRFELIGPNDYDLLSSPEAAALPPGLLVQRPAVDYRHSLELMGEADLLLIIDAPARESVFLPSKLVDYIGAGRPILALTPPGASAQVVQAIGGTVGDVRDDAACALALGAALAEAERDCPWPWGVSGVRARFAAERVGGEVAGLLRSVVLRARPRGTEA